MTNQIRRLGVVVATALLAVGVLGTAPAQARDITWGGDLKPASSSTY
jgi:hypothetical protein